MGISGIARGLVVRSTTVTIYCSGRGLVCVLVQIKPSSRRLGSRMTGTLNTRGVTCKIIADTIRIHGNSVRLHGHPSDRLSTYMLTRHRPSRRVTDRCTRIAILALVASCAISCQRCASRRPRLEQNEMKPRFYSSHKNFRVIAKRRRI